MVLLCNMVESDKGKESSIYGTSCAGPAAVEKLHSGFASLLTANCTWGEHRVPAHCCVEFGTSGEERAEKEVGGGI